MKFGRFCMEPLLLLHVPFTSHSVAFIRRSEEVHRLKYEFLTPVSTAAQFDTRCDIQQVFVRYYLLGWLEKGSDPFLHQSNSTLASVTETYRDPGHCFDWPTL